MLTKEKLDNKADEIWKSAIKLRGKFKAYEYQNVILPVIMLRRIECVLEDKREQTKTELLEGYSELRIKETDKATVREKKQKKLATLMKETELDEYPFWNTTNWTIKKIVNDNVSRISKNFRDYVNGFCHLNSKGKKKINPIEEIFEQFDFASTIGQMDKNDALEPILRQYANEPLGPRDLTNLEMGYIYEELLRKFSEQSGEEAGEHFTPREVIRLMVELLDIQLNPKNKNKAVSIYDPACGTGGMLSVAKEYLIERADGEKEKNLIQTVVELYGQEKQPKNYAICKADMLIKNEDANRITHGNSLVPDEIGYKERGDLHSDKKFDYMLSNPPFGVNWNDYAERVKKLLLGRYKGQLPAVRDGAFLFLMTMIQKMKKPEDGGSKIAIIFNGSPLSNGDAESGESEIRKYIFENKLLDCIVMLPDQLFYNTGIFTYVLLVNNKKPKEREDKVLIINAREQFADQIPSMGQKRHQLKAEHRKWIEEKYTAWKQDENCKVFNYRDFCFHRVEVVFHQTDENDKPMDITEKFPVKLNNKNVNEKVEFYGGKADFKITVDGKTIEFKLTSEEKFETKFINELKKKYPALLDGAIEKKEIQFWKKNLEEKTECIYTHRHYISDYEYIPYGKDIKEFVHQEIDKPIISIQENPPTGYEILPNKYFFKYIEPPKAENVLREFWKLEEQAEKIINQFEGKYAEI